MKRTPRPLAALCPLRLYPRPHRSLVAACLTLGLLALVVGGCGADGSSGGVDTHTADTPSDAKLDAVDTGVVPADTMGADGGDGELVDPSLDTDGDCIPDVVEARTGTNAADADSDADGILDGIEDSSCDGAIQDGETDPRTADTDGDGILDGDEDTNHNGLRDPGETDPTLADTDGDGIGDGIEVAGCLDPLSSDTDGDGILDGDEDRSGNGLYDPDRLETDGCAADTDADGLHDGCEDSNQNGVLDAGELDPKLADSDHDGIADGDECGAPASGCAVFNDPLACASDPRLADTDGDGLPDGVEVASTYANGATDPRNPDSDGDGLVDGLEDFNQDGVWDAEFGELDPTTPQTYAGKPDADSPVASTCRASQLRPVQRIARGDGDWLMLIEPEFVVAPVSMAGPSQLYRAATVFNDAPAQLAGFVLSKSPEAAATGAASELDALDVRLQRLPFFPRSFTTWDGFEARTAQYMVSGSGTSTVGTTSEMRNVMVAAILNVPLGSLSGLPGAAAGSATNYALTLTVVYRSPQRVLVMGALTPADQPVSNGLRVRITDLTNASALAQSIDTYRPACEQQNIDQLPLADFIFVIDDTSSMGEEQGAVYDAADAIFDAVNNSFLTARWAVASTEFEGTSGVSGSNVCGMLNDLRGDAGTDGSSGPTIWSTFASANKLRFRCKVKDPGGVQGCDPPPDSFFGGNEYGLKCAELAVDYVQGRATVAGAAPTARLQTPQSALIVILMTDEESYQVESGQMTLDQAVSYYDTFFNSTASSVTNLGPTVPFAIFKQTGCCATYDRLFRATPPVLPRSAAGNIDDLATIPAVIESVIRAAGGLASRILPKRPPISVSMKVVLRRAANASVLEVLHSSFDGWDFDPTTQAMIFFGASAPELNDDVALSYQFFEKRCTDPNGCATQ